MATVASGRPFYGVETGIIVLDSGIPRPIGDVGNAQTFPFPVHFEIAQGITPTDVKLPANDRTREGIQDALLQLDRRGIKVATTSCGLLSQYQREVADTSPIPVALSSLIQVPVALRIVPSHQLVMVVTVAEDGVGEAHLLGTGVTPDDLNRVVVVDVPHFAKLNLPGLVGDYDPDLIRADIVADVTAHASRIGNVGAVVLECTNLAPFTGDLRRALGLPVFDVLTLAGLLEGSVNETPHGTGGSFGRFGA